jgi:uncharacterized protein (TIGR04540 family)
MEIKKFYKTQRELALTINHLIDQYWADVYTEEQLNHTLEMLYLHNTAKVFKQGKFTTVLKQVCGKRRLEVVSHILDSEYDERSESHGRI